MVLQNMVCGICLVLDLGTGIWDPSVDVVFGSFEGLGRCFL